MKILSRILLLLALATGAASAQEVVKQTDVVYATHDGVPLKGDLYLPFAPRPLPVMLYIHGGA